MRKVSCLAAALAIVSLSAVATAQQRSRIHGTVVDSAGAPVVGAVVVAENPVSMPAKLQKKTNKKGEFVFNGIQVGDWQLRIEADSFLPHEAQVRVGVGDNVQLEITLEQAEGAALLATSTKAQQEVEEAGQALAAGNYDGAIALLQDLLEKAPEVHQIHFNLALAYEKKGDFEHAAEQFRAFLEKEPDYFDANFGLANALSRLNQGEEAIAYYEKSTEIQPENAVAFFNLGLARFQSDRLEPAAEAFTDCLRIDPTFADAHYMLGNISLRNKDTEAARKSYEKFLELAPDSPNAEAARQALESLKGAG